MAQVSPPLIALLREKLAGTSSAYEPDYLYMMRFPRIWSSPILGFCMRAPIGTGSIALALISDGKGDQEGQPDEVLFKTELMVPNAKDAEASASLLVILPEPAIGYDNFWIGFRFSEPVEVPLRMPAFVGERTAAKLDWAKLSGSLLRTPMEHLACDEKLGMPFLIPIYGEDPEVHHGA